jgi:AbiV family abortive infection protein
MEVQTGSLVAAPYIGALTAREIAMGIIAAQKNARRLLADARHLIENRSFASAAALAVTAIDERGKVLILRRFAVLTDSAELALNWKEFRSNHARDSGWGQAAGKPPANGVETEIDPDIARTASLDLVKHVSLFTDFLAERNWRIPQEQISEKLTLSIFQAATTMWGDTIVTEQEISMWMDSGAAISLPDRSDLEPIAAPIQDSIQISSP